MDNIKNKTALITGAARGIGFACAQKILQNGAKAIAILDLPTSNGQISAANLEKQFGKGKAIFIPCDVSNTQQFEESFKKAANALNGINIVINNAGMFDDKKWEQTIRVNVGGVIQGSLLAIDHMGVHKGGKGGILVNIASIASLDLFPISLVYCASKHDVRVFSQCLAAHYEKTGVRVGIICPGVTNTSLVAGDLSKKSLDFVTPEGINKAMTSLPTQNPENVAEAIVQIIQTGHNGAIWVTEAENPPYAVEIPPIKRLEITQ